MAKTQQIRRGERIDWCQSASLSRTTGGVIRLSPARSKTLVGRILPISPPIADALNRRRARRDPDSPLVFHLDGIRGRCGFRV